jgi:tetratricopeptide (TPR) repeat protein
MKRTLFIIALVAAISYVQAQCKTKVTNVYMYTNSGKLDKAKTFSDESITDACADTKTWAKTWYYRGNLYLEIALSKDDKYKTLDSNAVQVAYDAFQKAIDLDTKKEFYDDIQLQLIKCGAIFFDQGAVFYNAGNYEKSMDYFDKTASIYALFSITDSIATYYAALSAHNAGKYEKAMEYYKKCIKANYLKATVYSNLADIYRLKFFEDNPYKKIDVGTDTAGVIELLGQPEKKSVEVINKTSYAKWTYKNKFYMLMEYGKVSYYNTDSVITDLKSIDDGIKVIEKGKLLFPDDQNIIISEANLYLTCGKFDETKKALDKLIQKDSTNYSAYYAIGNVYFDQYNNEVNPTPARESAFTEAEKNCKKAIQLKSDYFDAIYMLGALYFNEGFRLENMADTLITSNPAKYNELKTKYDNLYKQATERLEKAAEIKADDYNTLISLKKLYARLGMTDKYNAINEKLKLMK